MDTNDLAISCFFLITIHGAVMLWGRFNGCSRYHSLSISRLREQYGLFPFFAAPSALLPVWWKFYPHTLCREVVHVLQTAAVLRDPGDCWHVGRTGWWWVRISIGMEGAHVSERKFTESVTPEFRSAFNFLSRAQFVCWRSYTAIFPAAKSVHIYSKHRETGFMLRLRSLAEPLLHIVPMILILYPKFNIDRQPTGYALVTGGPNDMYQTMFSCD